MAFTAQAGWVEDEIEMHQDTKNGEEQVRLKAERLKREEEEEEEAEKIEEEKRRAAKMRRDEKGKAQREELNREQAGLRAAAEERMRLKRQASAQLVGEDKMMKQDERKEE